MRDVEVSCVKSYQDFSLDDEQDRGSRAQPDIAGISTRDAERTLSAGEEQNYKALYRTLREGKG